MREYSRLESMQHRSAPLRPGILHSVLWHFILCLGVLLGLGGSWLQLSLVPGVGAQPPRETGEEPPAVGQEVVLRAETLEFFQQENRLIATGQVVIESGNAKMYADQVEVNTESGIGMATGQVRFLTPQDDVQASRLDFNLSAERGLLYDAVGVVAGGYHITGERIERLGPKTINVQRGSVTTCSQETPDWAFRSHEARIGVGNYVTLKHPSFWIKGVPVFYVPYFIFPIKDQRTTGFLPPQAGYSSTDGAMAKTEFFWAINDWMDATAGLEVLSNRGIKPEANFRYAIDPLSDGLVQGAYIQDEDTGDTLWRVLLQQRQEFGWGLRGLTQIDLRSDLDIERRFSRDLRQESQVRTVSLGALTKRFPNTVLTVAGASFDGIPESGSTQQFRPLPALYADQLSTPLLGPIFFAMEASYARLSATDVVDGTAVQRLDLFPQLRLPLAVAPWLHLTLSGGFRETLYDRRISDTSSTSRELPDFRAHLQGPTFRRRFPLVDRVAGQTGAFLHVIATRLDYRYVPRVDQGDLPAFEALDEATHFLDPLETVTLVDRMAAANYAKVSLVNRLFAHGVWGLAPGQMQEVARLVLSQGLDIREAAVQDGRLLGPLDVEIELFLQQRWRLVSALRLETATGEVEASSLQFVAVLAPGWSLVAGHHYRQDPDVQYVSTGVNMSLLDGLRLGYNVRYDGLSGTVREHLVSMQYQAQCWSVDMRLRLRDTEDAPFFAGTTFLIEFNLFNL